MKLYMAPLEGVTGYIFRQAFAKYYGGIDKYFTPFLSPMQNKAMNYREIEDILPEHNEGMQVVPQILTNKAELFIKTANILRSYGYEEVNLNLGCPSGTVVAKGKGSGFLKEPERLDEFLNQIYQDFTGKISIKTRIGVESVEEIYPLMEIFQKYPVSELTIHPRLQKEMYRGNVHRDIFMDIYHHTTLPLCYNGDIFTAQDYKNLISECPNLCAVMFGRGLIQNPGMAQYISGVEAFDKNKFLDFHEDILRGYEAIMSGDRNTLFKMKELWFYFILLFPHKEKEYKKLKKADSIRAYEDAVKMICSA